MAGLLNFNLDDADSDRGGVLPFRILVIGNFLQNYDYETFYKSEPIDVDVRTFGRVMIQQNLSLNVHPVNNAFSDTLLKATCAESYNLRLRGLKDFSPESIARREPSIRIAVKLLERLIACQESGGDTSLLNIDEVELQLFDSGKPDSIPALMYAIADLRSNINSLVNDLIHVEGLQKIEAAWRSLHWLVAVAGDHPLCEISFISVNKEILVEDISTAISLDETHLYELVYSREYGQFGGRPFGAIVTDLEFSHKSHDIDLLKNLSCLAAKSHAPLIAAAAPSFFGGEGYSELANMLSIEETLQGLRYQAWHDFQETAESVYIMLTLPRVLLRGRYSYEGRNITSGVYDEDITSKESNCLWGSAAFAFAVNCLESFKKHQLCTELQGDNGKVTGLYSRTNVHMIENIAPVEVMLSENREAELVRQGFTPLSVNKKTKELIFFSANSVHWGHCSQSSSSAGYEDMDQLLCSQFSYLFIILRVVHYLKVLSRSYIGGTDSVPAFEASLNRWLRNYVSDVENPSSDVRACRPLKNVTLKISDVKDDPGWYRAKLSLTPHLLYLGKHFELSLPFNVISPAVGE